MTRIMVTGTSSGIGEYTAKYLLAQKAEVIGVARRDAPALAGHAGYTHLRGDLSDPATVAEIARVAGQGPLDGVVFNAGILESVTQVANTKLADFRKVFDVNLFAVVDLTQALVPLLRATKGRAIYVSSGAATNAYTGWAAYGSSKAALNLVAATLAKEEPELTVVSVAPGVVDTGMQDLIRGTHVGTGEMGADAQKFLELKQSGKLVDPRDSGDLYGSLALRAPHSLSGKFFRYDDPVLQV